MITCGNFWMSVCGGMFSNQSMVHQNSRVPSPNAKPPPGNERLSGDYSGMMVNDLLIHMNGAPYIYQKLFTSCLRYKCWEQEEIPDRFCQPSGDVFLHRWTFDCYWHRGSECSHHSIGHRHQIGLRHGFLGTVDVGPKVSWKGGS